MGRTLTWIVCDTLLCVLNIILHSLGLGILYCLYGRRNLSPHKLILIHFAAIELLLNVVHLLHEISDLGILYSSNVHHFEKLHIYVQLCRNIGIMIQGFCILFLLTGDRLLRMYLKTQYHIICTSERASLILGLSWVINVASISTCVMVYYGITNDSSFAQIFYLYIDVTLNITFLMFAIFTYAYIFVKYTNSDMRAHGGLVTWKQRAISILQSTNYSITIWLIFAFLILQVIPDMMYTGLYLSDIKYKGLNMYVGFSKQLSDTVEAIIYIFFQKDVRALVLRKMSRQRTISSGDEGAVEGDSMNTPQAHEDSSV